MEFVFRFLSEKELKEPRAGELLIPRPHGPDGAFRPMAKRALEEGVKGFPQGTGPIERIVIWANPTLDDLLAAEFLRRLLAGEKLPAGAERFASYSTLVRQGLRPSTVPLEAAMECIFQVIRSHAGRNLSAPEAAEEFNAKWRRLAARIMAAAEEGIDPFTTSFLDRDDEFVEEQIYLRDDHKLFRDDVARGKQWTAKLPEGPPRSYALVLRNPKSQLFQHWSRDQRFGPGGKEQYRFLAVDDDSVKYRWTFTTDPTLGPSLKGLHENLQAAEAAADAQRAADDPWVLLYRETLVAAPEKGSLLTDKTKLRIVRRWMKARPLWWRRAVTAGSVAAAAAVLILAAMHFFSPGYPSREVVHEELSFNALKVATKPNVTALRRNRHRDRDQNNERTASPAGQIAISLARGRWAVSGPCHPQHLNQWPNVERGRRDASICGLSSTRWRSLVTGVQRLV